MNPNLGEGGEVCWPTDESTPPAMICASEASAGRVVSYSGGWYKARSEASAEKASS